MSRVEPVTRVAKGKNVAPLTDAVFVEKMVCFDFRAITTELALIKGISRMAFHMELFSLCQPEIRSIPETETPTTLNTSCHHS